MNHNTVVKTYHLLDLSVEIDYLVGLGYNFNIDALWKWGAILRVLSDLKYYEKSFTSIDIGGGLSPLHLCLSHFGKVINIDSSGFRHTWFPVNPNGIPPSSTIVKKRENIVYVEDSFYTYIDTLEDSSVDFIYDACSLIHFNSTQTKSKNDGVVAAMSGIKRVLKSGGHFISASDTRHANVAPGNEFIYPEDLLECFTSSGLIPTTVPDYELEPFYRDVENKHIPTKTIPNYYKGTLMGCSTCKGLPLHHCLVDASAGTVLTRSLFTLVKG